MMRTSKHWLADSIVAAIVAGIVSGAPSTIWAFAMGGDPWQATLAAGEVVVGPRASRGMLIATAAVVHGGMSLFWAAVLCAALPARASLWFTAIFGMAAGLLIALLDLLVIGRAFPPILRLPFLPQLADHLMFGAAVGAVVGVRSKANRKEAEIVTTPNQPRGTIP
ncbi:MAG TPA: hypothetical protein VGX76_22805 [Pirellulales bacterium]|jgi:hypothetical protein|nr:hypothetical protein [Pirellulales bacterium]